MNASDGGDDREGMAGEESRRAVAGAGIGLVEVAAGGNSDGSLAVDEERPSAAPRPEALPAVPPPSADGAASSQLPSKSKEKLGGGPFGAVGRSFAQKVKGLAGRNKKGQDVPETTVPTTPVENPSAKAGTELAPPIPPDAVQRDDGPTTAFSHAAGGATASAARLEAIPPVPPGERNYRFTSPSSFRGGADFLLPADIGGAAGATGHAPPRDEVVEDVEVEIEEGLRPPEGSDEEDGSGTGGEGADGASTALQQFEGVLADGESRREIARRGRSAEEEYASVRRRIRAHDTLLIDDEQVRAIDENNEGNKGLLSCFRMSRRQKMIAASLLVVAVIAVAVSLGLTQGRGQESSASGSAPTPPPLLSTPPSTTPPSSIEAEPSQETTPRFDRLREVVLAASLLIGLDASKALQNTSSSQYQALQWLADEDEHTAAASDAAFWSESNISNTTVGVETAILQRYGIVTLFFATGGGNGNWSRPLHFLEPVHECLWNEEAEDDPFGYVGIECLDETVVHGINLPSNDLVGSVPEEIAFLPGLQVLSLYSNQLQGLIPPSISSLSELVSIVLFDNELSGTIPTMANLYQLQYFYLYGNSLGGPIPSELSSLSDLRILELSLNELTGGIPEELSALQSLEGLSLSGNSLTGRIPESIGQLSGLSRLFLNDNTLSGPIPSSINELRNLEILNFAENGLSGMLPFIAGSLPSLREIGLYNNRLNGTIPEAMYSYTTLQRMSLRGNSLTGTVSPDIANLTELQYLDLADNEFSGSFPLTAPTSMGALEEVYLGWNSFSGTILSRIGSLQNLRLLDLFGNRFLGTLPEAMGDLTRLEGLSLAQNSFRGTVPRSFARLTSLEILGLERNELSGDVSFMCDVFNSSDSFLIADCGGDEPEIICECCNACCADNETGPVWGCFPI